MARRRVHYIREAWQNLTRRGWEEEVARRRVQYIREAWQNLTRRDTVGGKSGTAESTIYKGGVAELEEGGGERDHRTVFCAVSGTGSRQI